MRLAAGIVVKTLMSFKGYSQARRAELSAGLAKHWSLPTLDLSGDHWSLAYACLPSSR
jgi:hypothetical protein